MKIFPKAVAALLLSILFVFPSCKEKEVNYITIDEPKEFTSDSLRMNEIQIIGSHNSYRKKTYEPLLNFLLNLGGLSASLNPQELDYEHLPLDEQFSDFGVRQIELDIYYDPDGGRFYDRMGNQLITEPVASGIVELNEPGMKVLHIPDIDYETHYISFKQALQAVKNWSDANPRHLPIYILIEAKETGLSGLIPILTWTETLPFNASAFSDLQQEIKDVFGEALEKVITPNEVRGGFATLNEAVTTIGWPHISEARGKIVFLLDNENHVKDLYVQSLSFQERILFTSEEAGNAEAAFVKRNNAFSTDIEALVAQGYIVRTRSDDGTDEARSGNKAKRERAFASGAQLISTDYYLPDPRHTTTTEWTNYSVRFEGNAVARLNPINGPSKFKGDAFE